MDLTNTYYSLISNESNPIKANILEIEKLVNPESNNIKRYNGINQLDLIYANEPFPITTNKSIFLAGPTPRNSSVPSWRTEAIQILQKINYDGIVFIPEPRNGNWIEYYEEQISWEKCALDIADIIIFWIPRDLSLDNNNYPKMAGLTTNIEFGLYYQSNKLFVGIPENSLDVSSNQYIRLKCDKNKIPFFTDLYTLLHAASNKLGKGAFRKECECCIPLYLWNNKEFQYWYNNLINNGNQLLDLKINYSFVMPKAQKLFLWIASAIIYVTSENRIKSNEFVLSRTNIASTVLIYLGNSYKDTYIILTKEFRTPCTNSEDFVYELPGGSSLDDTKNELIVAGDEVLEELGFKLNIDKLKLIGTRQSVATLSAHRSTAYMYLLNDNEFFKLKNMENSQHGLAEDSEQTYLVIKSLDEILNNDLLDWNNIGIILSAYKAVIDKEHNYEYN